MTEPIKLPPDPLVTMNKATLDRQIAYAVEQATADLRAELTRLSFESNRCAILAKDRIEKAEAERDEARAELARLTTLRPHTGHTHTGLALWRFASGAATVSRKAQAGSIGWTPLPPVKEAMVEAGDSV
jgi:hypothetical protein